MAAASAEPETVEKVAARALAKIEGVYAAYPRVQVEEGRLGNTDLAARIYKGFHPKLAGDVLLILDPLWFTE